MRSATLILPLPPSINSYLATVGNRRVISKAGREFKRYVAQYCLINRVPQFGSARLLMKLTLSFRDKRSSDIDNRTKCLWDSLKDAGVIDDDEQFDTLFIERGETKKGGECVVFIKVLE